MLSFTLRSSDAPMDAAIRRSILRKKQSGSSQANSGSIITPKLVTARTGPITGSLRNSAIGLSAGVGLGAVCVYGLTQKTSNQINTSIIDQSSLWPEFVRTRLRKTFVYLGGSLSITALSAFTAFRNPNLMKFVLGAGRRPILTMIASYAAVIGTGMLLHSVPYGHPSKHVCWILHASTLGVLLSPILFVGGPLIVQAAWYTAGITGSLALVSACAPSHSFLNWSGPLSVGLGAVVLASIGSMFIGPPVGLFSSGLYSISTYGGLVVFSGFLLYDVQKIARKAESLPPSIVFDPINESTSVFLDILNIFTRIVMILAGNNNRKSGNASGFGGSQRTNFGIGGGGGSTRRR